jgi:hypothetical protein
MHKGFIVCFLFLGWINPGVAEETASNRSQVISTYIARTGEQFQAPHVLTYRLAEYEQQRGRWTFPDLGVYGTSQGKDKLVFLGASADFHPGKGALFTQELYFTQDTGPGSHGARSLWVWPVLDLSFTPRLTAEVVAYPTVPLNRAAQAAFNVDRAKLEYALRRNWTAGPGYSSSICEGSAWKNEPFLTTTVSSSAGSFEFWIQRMPGGGQLQLRYKLARVGR